MAETTDITSGDIAAEVERASQPAGASPAPQAGAPDKADPSTIATAAQPEAKDTRIPLADHERILKGFYDRIERVAWANNLNPDEVQEALAMRRQALADRQAAARKQAALTVEGQDDQGRPYTSIERATAFAKQLAEQIVNERMAELEERIGPIESTFSETRRYNAVVTQAQAAASWPGFADHLDEITEAITENTAMRQHNPRIPALTLHEAYINIVPNALADVSEKRLTEEKKKWLAELNSTTAETSKEINPSRTPSGSRKPWKEMSFRDAIPAVVAELTAKRSS